MTAFHVAILAAYFVLLGLFSIYGLHKYWLVYLFYRHGRKRPVPEREFTDEELPRVTVQLPVFNEMYVVERVLDAAARIRYPRDRFEIQVLDDSTDETTEIARRKAEELRARGLDVTFLHRDDRRGFKAGALEAGMEVAKGEYFAIFDADFLPGPDFLEKTIHHFTSDGIGLVQMRWDHLNRRTNFLTNVTSIYLDGHFIVESTSRSRSGSFVNFHGTAGIWRKQAILDAGGWEHDTLTEDLDLSYRSQLAGWRFVYLMEEGTPAELPAQMTAFKAQQHRWAKGAIQTMRKVLPLVWKADLPLRVKIEATFHLAGNFAYIFMIAMLMLMLPAMIIRLEHDLGVVALFYDLSVFVLVTASFFCFYLVSQLHGDRNWRDTIRYTPFLMGMGIGLAVNNSRAVIEALAGQTSPFVRTPKLGLEGVAKVGPSKYRARRSWQPLVELALGAYFLVILFTTIHYHAWMGIPFTVLFLAGFVYIGTTSLMEGRRRPAVGPKPA